VQYELKIRGSIPNTVTEYLDPKSANRINCLLSSFDTEFSLVIVK